MVGYIHGENFKLVTFDLTKLFWIEMFNNWMSHNLPMCVDQQFSQISAQMLE